MSPQPRPDTLAASGEEYVRIVRGSIHVAAELVDRYFRGVSAVAAVARGGVAMLLPLRGPAAGGLLLKVRNARGDRVLHADEFLRTIGMDANAAEQRIRVRWVAESGGLVLEVGAPGATGSAPSVAEGEN